MASPRMIWKSVDIELPGYDEPVLVRLPDDGDYGREVWEGRLIKTTGIGPWWYIAAASNDFPGKVTHWMPMPTLPSKDSRT